MRQPAPELFRLGLAAGEAQELDAGLGDDGVVRAASNTVGNADGIPHWRPI